MTVADKLRSLRLIEGQLRGLHREMTQKEVAAAIKSELDGTISQPYLSQLEKGQRKHLTHTTRLLLAKFFRVHPGYLVDDPEGFQTELMTDLPGREQDLDLWLIEGAEHFRKDPAICSALIKLARHPDTRKCVMLFGKVLDNPELIERLWDALESSQEETSRDLA